MGATQSLNRIRRSRRHDAKAALRFANELDNYRAGWLSHRDGLADDVIQA